jgi:carboxyl-terminal processing protease
MRASNSKELTIVALILVATSIKSVLFAGEAGAEQPSAVVDNESPSHLAEVTWLLLETINQQHISPPSRESLMAGVVTAVAEGHRRNLQDSAAKLMACQSQDEFTSAFVELWHSYQHQENPRSTYLFAFSASMPIVIRVVSSADYNVQEQLQNNRYVGLGVNAGRIANEGPLGFHRIVPGGAADRAGLVDGETVLEVDGHDTSNVPVDKVISDWLRGPAGSQVTLKLGPIANRPTRSVTLTRSVVRIDSVTGRNGTSVSRGEFRDWPAVPIGHLRVGIKGSTLQELRDAEIRLRADGIRVLILDFRTGDSSIDFHHAGIVADGLLDGGLMWSWQNRDGQRHEEIADRECLFRDLPLIVMVNKLTSPTQLAVAAALQDHGRAVVVGEQARRGGFILTSIPFADGRYYAMMETTRLIRPHTDRAWPLAPDYPTEDLVAAETLKTRMAQHSRSLARANSRTVPNPFYVQRGVESGASWVSALFPANLDEIEILRRIGVDGLTLVSPIQHFQNPNVEIEDETARKVAMQLLEKVYQQDAARKRSNWE